MAFHRRWLFPMASDRDWNDWRWQMKNRITSLARLERLMELTPDERAALEGGGIPLPFAITPYYFCQMDPHDPLDPIRRSIIPTVHERALCPGEQDDPLGEEHDTVVEGLVHRYPDRVLFLATSVCSNYCRYCTRSRLVGRRGAGRTLEERWERCFRYIQDHPEVRDVLVSGGDPLTLGDKPLERLLTRLRSIDHVEIVRLGTKAPVVMPQRITDPLVRMLRRFHPLFMSIHFTHPAELTPEVATACGKLADAGIPLGSQTVLLRGINDDVAALKRLYTQLLRLRVRPYYLYQCDPIQGSAHFRTSVSKGLEVLAGLRGHTTGYAVPTYVIDAPGGGGKIPLMPDACVGREDGDLLLRNYEGKVFRYPDHGPSALPVPEVDPDLVAMTSFGDGAVS
jgi:lysine 2,3-aminomutase